VAGVAARDVVVLEVDDFCHREYPRLYGTLRLYCGDVWLAEELAQEALARAVRRWDRVGRMDAPGAWVHRVAINLANSWFRRSAAERRVLRRTSVGDAHEDPDSATLIAVRQAVAALSPRQREVVILRFFHDLPVRAAAERMACAEGTVKSLLADAIRSLRARGLEVSGDE
jgi:RNA polymerase sigma factor (sigma-70 family)